MLGQNHIKFGNYMLRRPENSTIEIVAPKEEEEEEEEEEEGGEEEEDYFAKQHSAVYLSNVFPSSTL